MFRNALLTVAVALLATLTIALLVYLPRIAHRDRYVLVGTSARIPRAAGESPENEVDLAAMYVFDRQTGAFSLVTGARGDSRIYPINMPGPETTK